jgi:hypothetical protein
MRISIELRQDLSPTTASAVRELDRRTADGIDVRLLWHPHTDQVSVAVEDLRGGKSFEVEVAGGEALDAFRHPYAYLSTPVNDRALAARASRQLYRS